MSLKWMFLGGAVLMFMLSACNEHNSPVEGKWAWPKDPQFPERVLVLAFDGKSFELYEIDKGKKSPPSQGTWINKGETLILTVKQSKCCKIPEGDQIKIKVLGQSKESLHVEFDDGQKDELTLTKLD